MSEECGFQFCGKSETSCYRTFFQTLGLCPPFAPKTVWKSSCRESELGRFRVPTAESESWGGPNHDHTLQPCVNRVCACPGRGDLQPQLDSAMQDVSDKYLLLEETEKQAVRKALVEERGRFCCFVSMLRPVVVSRSPTRTKSAAPARRSAAC